MNIFSSLLVLLMISASAKGTYSYSLKSFEGKKNVLILFAPTKSDERFVKQLEFVKSRYGDFKKIQTSLVYAFAEGQGRADSIYLRPNDAADLRKIYKISDQEFRLVLVDKAGKVKKESKEVLDRDRLNKFLSIKDKP